MSVCLSVTLADCDPRDHTVQYEVEMDTLQDRLVSWLHKPTRIVITGNYKF